MINKPKKYTWFYNKQGVAVKVEKPMTEDEINKLKVGHIPFLKYDKKSGKVFANVM